MRPTPLIAKPRPADAEAREPDNEALVLETLRATDTHPTAGELYDAVRLLRPRIGRATVYRALQRLAAAGLAVEVARDSLGRRYDARVERHDHCVCARCGHVLDVALPLSADATFTLLAEIAARAGFTASTFEFRLYGLCAECQLDDAEPIEPSDPSSAHGRASRPARR